jgi:bacteriocin-like protein
MDQNLMVQELSDNELEQVVGGHCYKPQSYECHEHRFHPCEPKPCYPHHHHRCEPVVRCHVGVEICHR